MGVVVKDGARVHVGVKLRLGLSVESLVEVLLSGQTSESTRPVGDGMRSCTEESTNRLERGFDGDDTLFSISRYIKVEWIIKAVVDNLAIQYNGADS